MPKVLSAPPYRIYNEDCFQTLARIPSASVDMVLCDLPYGTTACKWDVVIPFEPLWEEWKRVCKFNSPIVLTASQPFTATLIVSNIAWFKYCWVWEKPMGVNPQLAKIQPLKVHEDICVFGRGPVRYFPQGLKKCNQTKDNRDRAEKGLNHLASHKVRDVYRQEMTNYPRSVLKFGTDRGLHPTQKSLDLFSYLVRTYSETGAVVLDNCMGSGTTGVAAMHLGRNFIGCDSDTENGYFETAELRIKTAWRQAQQKRPSIEPGRV